MLLCPLLQSVDPQPPLPATRAQEKVAQLCSAPAGLGCGDHAPIGLEVVDHLAQCGLRHRQYVDALVDLLAQVAVVHKRLGLVVECHERLHAALVLQLAHNTAVARALLGALAVGLGGHCHGDARRLELVPGLESVEPVLVGDVRHQRAALRIQHILRRHRVLEHVNDILIALPRQPGAPVQGELARSLHALAKLSFPPLRRQKVVMVVCVPKHPHLLPIHALRVALQGSSGLWSTAAGQLVGSKRLGLLLHCGTPLPGRGKPRRVALLAWHVVGRAGILFWRTHQRWPIRLDELARRPGYLLSRVVSDFGGKHSDYNMEEN
ncbi:hypothetical protein BX070DRAFT_1195 [Coemansia spiralis]|nr:hypothetical protein BX070DRAFT_1195 [Coemansia spiralis]